jgi:hypothetical protein
MADEILSGLKAIKVELKSVQDQMAGLDAGSQEFIKLAQKAGELKDRMNDVKEAVTANAGPAIQSFGNNLGIARGQLMDLDITGFGESMQRMGANVKNINFKEMNEGVKSATSGFSALGKALLTNPLFLLITTIALIIANFDKLRSAGGLIGKMFSFIGDQIELVKNGIVAFLDWTGLTNSKAEEMAEAAKKRNEEMVADLQKANDAIDKMKDDIARSNMSDREKELDDIKKWYDEQLWLARGNEASRNEITKLAREKQDAINKKYDDQEAEKRQASYQKNKELADKEQKEKIDRSKVLADFNEQQDEEDWKMALEQTEKMGKLGTETTDKERERAIQRVEIAKTAIDELNEVEKEALNTRIQRELEANEKRIQDEKLVQQAKYDIALKYLSAAQSLTDAMTTSGLLSAKKSFEVGKAISIAQTTISTIMGVQNALNATSTVPEPFGMALKVANAVAIGAAGAASLAKIASTKFDGGGAGGGTTTPSMPTPSGGAMGGASSQAPAALNLSGLQGNTSVAPLQTYVLAGQVSGAQQAEFKIKNTASILGGG